MLATHEIDILQCIKSTAESLANDNTRGKVSQGDIVAAAMKRNPTRISPRTIMVLTKFYIGFLENGMVHLIKELVDFHAHSVNPKELSVSISFFQLLVTEEALKKCPETRMGLLFTEYISERRSAARQEDPQSRCSWRPSRSLTYARSLRASWPWRTQSRRSEASTCRVWFCAWERSLQT